MSDRFAGPGRVDKSPACAREAHGDCSHVVAQGGGLNPKRLRLEFGAALCPCSCHSNCPVVLSGKRITVPLSTWRDSCTCPGAEQERRLLYQDGATNPSAPDFGETWEDTRRRLRARKEASRAARAKAAAGKSRDEIREIYLAEWNTRGFPRPDDAVLEAIVDRISGNPLPGVRLGTEYLVHLGKEIHGVFRIIRSGD